MIELSEARELSGSINNPENVKALIEIERIVRTEAAQGKWQADIIRVNLTTSIINHLKFLGYKVVRTCERGSSMITEQTISWE